MYGESYEFGEGDVVGGPSLGCGYEEYQAMKHNPGNDWGRYKQMSKTVKTGKFRLSYPTLAEPRSFDGNPPMYSIVMLFDKKTSDIKELQALAKEALETKWGKDKPKNLKSPFRDGDKEKEGVDGYAGCWFITAKSRQQPGCMTSKNQKMTSAEILSEMYAGCFCRALLTAYAYDVKGNKGVAFGLQHIQKLADGDSLSGRVKAENAFDVIEDDGTDFSDIMTATDDFSL